MRLSRLGTAVAACLLMSAVVMGGQPAHAVEVLTVTPTGSLGPYGIGSSPTAFFTIAPDPAGSPVHLEWSLRSGPAESDPVAASGSADVTIGEGSSVPVTFDIPASLVAGTVGLEVVASDDVPGTGPATGSSGILPVEVVEPATVVVTTSVPTVYPAVDHYRDSVELRVTSNKPAQAVLEVVGGAGKVQRAWPPVAIAPGSPVSLTWDGRTTTGIIPAAGSYTVRATVTEPSGVVAVAGAALAVSRAKAKWTWTTFKYQPATSMYDAFVGRCSKLVTPSSHGGAGSQGYYSLAKCTRTANNRDVVVGLHSGYLPRAFENTYGDLRISVYGGMARRERRAYLVLGYYRASDNEFLNRVQLTLRFQWHQGDTTRAKPFVRYTGKGRPYVVWSTGLAEGSRYDVQEFKVSVVRKVLRNPDGSLVWPSDTRAHPAAVRPPLASGALGRLLAR